MKKLIICLLGLFLILPNYQASGAQRDTNDSNLPILREIDIKLVYEQPHPLSYPLWELQINATVSFVKNPVERMEFIFFGPEADPLNRCNTFGGELRVTGAFGDTWKTEIKENTQILKVRQNINMLVPCLGAYSLFSPKSKYYLITFRDIAGHEITYNGSYSRPELRNVIQSPIWTVPEAIKPNCPRIEGTWTNPTYQACTTSFDLMRRVEESSYVLTQEVLDSYLEKVFVVIDNTEKMANKIKSIVSSKKNVAVCRKNMSFEIKTVKNSKSKCPTGYIKYQQGDLKDIMNYDRARAESFFPKRIG